jgi:hypothetical protein
MLQYVSDIPPCSYIQKNMHIFTENTAQNFKELITFRIIKNSAFSIVTDFLGV